MSKLPDLEGLAIFAKVVEMRSFAGAAAALGLSKPTVSKAVSRLEGRLGARLFNRTSRRLAVTDAGKRLAVRAAHILAEGEAAESEAVVQSAAPKGLVRLAAPMSFGLRWISPLLPDFLAAYPDVSVDLHLSDATVDIIGDGFDMALRIAIMPDSSLVARRLCPVPRYVVGAPSYLKKHGRPTHPLHLADHVCFGYAYLAIPDTWRFTNSKGEEAQVRPSGVLRANNGDALMPALLAGQGLALLPDFFLGEALAQKQIETVLDDWTVPSGGLYLVMPPGGPRPARITALAEFLAKRLAQRDWHTA
ncbi:MAG: transcriptional regulator, LysR family [Rhodospirillales bacterium]|nr:transcriptional regulator, LysR family [Rhodospirillales bacterium]